MSGKREIEYTLRRKERRSFIVMDVCLYKCKRDFMLSHTTMKINLNEKLKVLIYVMSRFILIILILDQMHPSELQLSITIGL